MKTAELTGAALDWAVAKCEGLKLKKFERRGPWYYAEADGVYRFIVGHTYSPSTDWSQGGPIIEREMVELYKCLSRWSAVIRVDDEDAWELYGPTHLVAAMRAYVASKMGVEVAVPAELED